MSELTILILDDDKVMRESFTYYFEDLGWRILSAETAERALDLIEHDRPDGAIIDVRLPGIDGPTFLHEAKKRYPQMAFVICTGSIDYRLPEDIARLGNISNMVFAKPVYNIQEVENALLAQIDKLKSDS